MSEVRETSGLVGSTSETTVCLEFRNVKVFYDCNIPDSILGAAIAFANAPEYTYWSIGTLSDHESDYWITGDRLALQVIDKLTNLDVKNTTSFTHINYLGQRAFYGNGNYFHFLKNAPMRIIVKYLIEGYKAPDFEMLGKFMQE